MRKCPKCGNEIKDDWFFCRKCGAVIEGKQINEKINATQNNNIHNEVLDLKNGTNKQELVKADGGSFTRPNYSSSSKKTNGKSQSSKKLKKQIAIIVISVVVVILIGMIAFTTISSNDDNIKSRQESPSSSSSNINDSSMISDTKENEESINYIDSDSVTKVFGFNDNFGLFQYTTNEEYHGTRYHYGCVNKNGEITFNDIDGLKDDQGNSYFIDCRYNSEIPYTEYFDFLWEYETSEEYYNDTSSVDSPYIFENDCICVVCRDCDADVDGNYYVCIINSDGNVKYKWNVGKYDCEKNKYTEESGDESGAEVSILKNGNGTYIFCVSEKIIEYIDENDYNGYLDNREYPEEYFYNYYAVSSEKGELKHEEMRDTYNAIYSLGSGYFRCHEEELSVKNSKTKKFVIDKNGNVLNNNKALQIDRFVTESLAKMADSADSIYYNINTNNFIGDFSKSKELFGESDDIYEIYKPVDFSNGKGYAGCFIRNGKEYDDKATISYVKYNENGKFELLKTFNNSFTWGEMEWDYDYIKYLSINEDRILVREDGKYYSFNLKTGETILLFEEYSTLISDIHVCNGIVEADIKGKDRNDYYQIFGMDGKLLINLTERDDDFNHCYMEACSGFDYWRTIITSDGDVIDSDEWCGNEYCGEMISVSNDENENENYMNRKGEIIIGNKK